MKFKFNSKVEFIPLEASIKDWINAIEKAKQKPRKFNTEELQDSIYDINNAHVILEQYYSFLSKKGE